jgi:hypothetical protein
MATRNLTKKFFELRNSAKASKSLGITKDDSEESGGESGLLKVSLYLIQVNFMIYLI